MKDLRHMHSKQMRHKEASINVLKDKNQKNEEGMVKLEEELSLLKDRLVLNENLLKRATAEVLALKKRIEKMKQNNFRGIDVKLCKKCHKEYSEAENYNWSCRTH